VSVESHTSRRTDSPTSRGVHRRFALSKCVTVSTRLGRWPHALLFVLALSASLMPLSSVIVAPLAVVPSVKPVTGCVAPVTV